MKALAAFALVLLSLQPALAVDSDIAPGGTLRAAYLGGNPAQAVRDSTGAIRGASADVARELARRIGVPVEFKPLANPKAVIDAVTGGDADIGFIAYAPERVGTVEFSQAYVLSGQGFLVLEESSIRTIADVDRAGQKIAGGHADSISLFMKRKFKHATLSEISHDTAEIKRLLLAKEIDAFGANRQRLANIVKEGPGFRILPDNLFGVPQTIIAPKGKTEVLAAINRFIDDVRASGFLKKSVEASGVAGLEVAPGGSWTPSVPD
jgi:polar amino acid transport system substrate-binding protein